MKTYEYIEYSAADQVARITLNRPHYRNAQSRRLLEELDEAFAIAGADREVHVIALFGAGEHFSAGHDLGTEDERSDREKRPLQAGLRGRFDHSREQFVDKTLRLRNVPKPTIAGVQGFAGHLTAAHTMHMLSSEGEKDAGYALKVPAGARRPMVERAFENYRRRRDEESGS